MANIHWIFVNITTDMWWNKLCHDHFYVYVLLQYSYKLGVVNCKKFLIGKLTSRDFDPYCWVPPINFPLTPIGSYSNQKIIVIIEIFRVWLSSGDRDTSLCLRPCVLMSAVLTAWLFYSRAGSRSAHRIWSLWVLLREKHCCSVNPSKVATVLWTDKSSRVAILYYLGFKNLY